MKSMTLNALTAVSPIDGRYHDKTKSLAKYFSEFALIHYRVRVEIEYFIQLCSAGLPQLQTIDTAIFPKLRQIYTEFSEADAQEIKTIERTTNHDVKAVEYFIKRKFDELQLSNYKEFIHFGLTSQDVNNTAVPLSLHEAMEHIIYPHIEQIVQLIKTKATEWSNIPMLARTHGQPASPTRLGKELAVFAERLQIQLKQLQAVPYSAKFGGATGNFNAHHVAYPTIDWQSFGNQFVEQTLGLTRSKTTTQIEHYDNLAAFFDASKRINTILIDFSRDVWQYISMNYFKQQIAKNEVGSSAMPHKVNPIDFENAEGNLGISIALFEHLAAKLPISRLQRDLTDSTVLRNIGVPLSHTLIALQSLAKGISKLLVNEQEITQDLEENWSVVAEAIQTILRREFYPNPYEALKELTRTHGSITAKSMADFIQSLDVDNSVKQELMSITPYNYTGI